MLTDAETDRLFQALADTTRRDIVTRVLQREQSVSELAGHYAMSFAAVQKHVAVLERASLVTKQRRGREQMVGANMDALRRAGRLLDRYEQLWRRRVLSIEDVLTGSMPADHASADRPSPDRSSTEIPSAENPSTHDPSTGNPQPREER
ncbi:putative transcriptional regulator, ArsR family protein [Kocuria dechangensis]|uniref:Transcriptional regulator, ArsR family protein n=1 Tax=Kocuria dechangensis TaxID=1176249 RepID=A0A917LMI0_9MICC|nr:putative transcriptional regulator, ArsR family protein [Kocuria dechangensis]